MVGGLAPATVVALAQRTLGRTLPTCLWWAASKPTRDDVLLVGLAEFAKYLVLDTAQGTNSASAIADVSHVTSRLPKLELRDMAWNRVASWRDAVARLFDDPSATAELSRIIRLEVSGSSLSEALYLAGWLASRLGWSVTRDQRFLDSHGGLVTFISHVVDAEPQRLELIRLRSAAAEFSAQISEHGEAITCTFGPNGGPFQSYVVPFAPLEASQLIERSLFRKGNDELFDAALRIVRDLGEIS
jgi:glucose-6-phosphate dehydrogenase assembly protein OpcA